MFFKRAVLIIHGLGGGTYDIEYLANYLQTVRSFYVYTFTLPGHDRILQSKIKKEDWLLSVDEQVEILVKKGYKKIYVIGHSMGGVLASYVAANHKEVKKLVLAAPAFIHILSEENSGGAFKKVPSIIRGYGIGETISRLFKMAPVNFIEFTSLVKKYKDVPTEIKIPTIIIQGQADELVPEASAFYVYNKLQSRTKKLILYKTANHDLFRSNDNKKIAKAIIKFLRYTPYLRKTIKKEN